MKRRAITNEKESKKRLHELEKQCKAEAKWLEKERKKEESRKRKNAATLIRNRSSRDAFNELRNTAMNTMQRTSIANSTHLEEEDRLRHLEQLALKYFN